LGRKTAKKGGSVNASGNPPAWPHETAPALRHLLPGVEHRKSRHLNNRAENSHRPTRRRKRQMQRFKSSGRAQDFFYARSYQHYRPRIVWYINYS
jgi:transposase-like protein